MLAPAATDHQDSHKNWTEPKGLRTE
jgi:hypothetical protein